MRKKSSLTLLSSRKKKTRAAAAAAQADARGAAKKRDSRSSSTNSREDENNTAAAAASDGDAAAATACEVGCTSGKRSNASSRHLSEERPSVTASAPGQHQPEQPQQRQRRQRRQHTEQDGEEEGEEEDEQEEDTQVKRKRQRRKQQEGDDNEEGGEEGEPAAAATGAAEGSSVTDKSGVSGCGSTTGTTQKTRLLGQPSSRPTSRWRQRKSATEYGEEEDDDDEEQPQQQRGRSRRRKVTEKKTAASRGEKVVSSSDSGDADSSDGDGGEAEEDEQGAPPGRRSGTGRLNNRSKAVHRCRKQANSAGRRRHRRIESRFKRRKAAHVEVERGDSDGAAACRSVRRQRKLNSVMRGAPAASSSDTEEEDTEDALEGACAAVRSAAAGRGGCGLRRRRGRGGGAADAACLRSGRGRRKGGSRRKETALYGRQEERESEEEEGSEASSSGSTSRSGGEAEEKPTGRRQGRRGGPGKRRAEKEYSEGERKEEAEQTDFWYDDYFSFNECNVQEELVLDALVATIKKTHAQHYYGDGMIGEQEQKHKLKPEEEEETPGRSSREERPQREKALSFLASLRKGGGGASRKSSAAAVSLTPAVGRERKRDKRGRPTEEELAAEAAAAAEFEKAEATLRTMTSDALLIKKAWAFVAEDAYETRLAAAAATCAPVPAAAVTSVEPEASASAGSQRGRRQELATTSEVELQQGGRRRTRTPGSAAASESAAAHPVAGAGAAAPEAAGSPRARQRDGEELARGSDSSGAAEGGAEGEEEKAAQEQESGDNKEGEKRITKGTLSAGEKRQQRIREDDSSSSPSPQQSTSDGCSDATLAAAAVATTAAAEAANEEARGEALETGLRARWEKYVLLREQRVATELRIQDLIRLQERRGAQKRQHQAQQSKEEQRVKGEEQQQQRECKVGETRSETAKGSSGDPCVAAASSEAVRTSFSAAVNPVAAAFLAAEGMPRAKEEWRKQQLAAAMAAQKRGQSAVGKSEEEKCVKSLGQGDGCEQCKSSGMPTAAADAPGTVKTTAAAHPSSPAAAAPGTVKSTIAAAASTVVSVETAGTKAAEQGERKATHVTEGGHEREEGRVVVAGSDDAVAAATTGETGGGVADARSEQGVPLKVTTGGGEDAGGRPKEEGGGKAVSAREEKEVRIDAPGASGLSGSRSRSRTPGRDESSRSHSLPRGQEDDEGDEEGAAREKEEEEEEKAEKLLRKLTQADADESLTSSSSSSSSSESRSSDEEDSLYEEDTALGDPPSSPEEEDEEATRSRKHAGTGELPAPDGEQKAAAAEEMGGRATVGGGRRGKVATTGGRGKGRGTAAAGAAAFVSEATAAEEEAQDASGGMRGKGRTGRKGSNTDEEEEKDERKREKRDRSFSGGSAGEGGPEALPAGCKKKKLSTAAKLRLRWERDKQKKRLKTGDTLMDDVFARCSAPLSIDQATKMKNLSVPATLLLRPQCLYTVEDDWERLHCRKYPNGLLRRGTLATHAFRIEETLEFFLFCRFLNLFASTIDIQWTFDSLVAGFACMSPLPPFPAAAARREGATAGKVAGKDGAASPAQTQARDTEEANDPSLPAEAASSCCSNSNKDNGEQDNPSNSNRTRSINSSGSGASDNSDSSGNNSSENLCGRSGCNNYGNYGSTEMFRLLLQKIFSFVGRRFTPGMSLVRMCGRYVEEKRKEGVLPVGMLWPFDYSFKFGVAKLPATRDKDSSNKDSTSREGSNRGKESGSSDRKESSATRKENNGKKEENSSAETSSSTREGRGNVPAEERASSVLETASGTGEEKSSNSVNKKTVYQSASSSGSMRGTREDEEAEVSSGEKVLMESVYNPFKLCEEWNQLKSIHKLRVVRLLVDQALSESPQIQKARKKLTDADLEMGYKGTDMLGKLYWLVPQCGDETIFKLYREDPSTQRMEILCEDIASLESVAEALGMDEKTADMKDVLLRCHEDLLIQEKQKSREIRRDKARRRQLEISAWGLPSSARRERKPVDYTYAAYDGTLEGRASAGATAASSAEGQRLDRGERLRARQAKKEERMTAEAIEVAESSGDTAPTEGSAAAGAGKPTASSSKDPADTKKPIRKRQPKGAAVVLRSQADVLRQHQAYLMQHRHHSHFALQQSQALLLSQQLQRIQEEKEAAARQGAAARMYQQQQQPVQGGVTNSAGATCSAPAGVAQLPQAALAMLQQRLQQVHHHLLQQEGLTTQQRQAALQHACARLQTELLARYGAVSTERTATPQQQQLIQQHLMRQQQQQQLQARHQMQQQQHMIQQHLQHLQEQVQRQHFMHPSQQLQQQQLLQRQVPHLSVQDSDLLERRAALLQQSFQAHQLHLTRSAGGTLPQQHVQPPNYLVAMPFNAGVRAANGAPPVNAATVSASALSSEAAYAGFLRQPAVGLETNACRTLPLDTVSPAAVVYESADPRVRCSGSSGKEDAIHRKADTAYISERRAAPMDASSCSLPPPGAGFSQSSSSANVVIGGGAAASPGPAISAGNMQYAVWASAGGRNSATLHAHNVLSGGGDPPSHAAASGRSDAAPTPSPYPGLSLSSNASPHGVAPTLASLPHAKVSASHLTAPLPSSSVHGGDTSSSSSQTRRAPQLACPIPPHLDTLRSCHAIPSRLPACSTDCERYSLHSRESPRESLSGGVEERYGVSVNFNGAGDTTDQVKGGGAFKQFTEGQQHQQVHGYKSYEGSG